MIQSFPIDWMPQPWNDGRHCKIGKYRLKPGPVFHSQPKMGDMYPGKWPWVQTTPFPPQHYEQKPSPVRYDVKPLIGYSEGVMCIYG